MRRDPRSFEMELDLLASPEEVWRALTEARELERWFPLRAEVEPGAGGRVLWEWGDAWRWETRIEEWRPGERLVLSQLRALPFDTAGGEVSGAEVEPASIALEFTLAGRGGATRLRLVHSGFGRGAAWDDELDGVSHGWRFELAGLKHYLERQRGRDRRMIQVLRTTSASREEVWALLRTGGLEIEARRDGGPFRATLPSGQRFTGRTVTAEPDRQLAGVVAELDDGLFRVETWRAAGTTGVMLSAASWEPLCAPLLAEVEREARRWLAELVPAVA